MHPRNLILAVACALFVALTVLVELRLVAGIDWAVSEAFLPLASPALDVVGNFFSIVFSAEISVLLALIAATVLWRRGYGVWSLAPLGFVVPVAIEVVMKETVHQPYVAAQFHREVYYPLAHVQLAGSFPSGHAIRTSFLATFVISYAVRRPALWARIVSLVMALTIAVSAFTRVYLGDHWASDVVAGTILGAIFAIASVRAVNSRAHPRCHSAA